MSREYGNPFVEDFKRKLKNYKNIENAITQIEQRLEELKAINDPKGFNSNSFNSGGADYNKQEEKMINYLAESNRLNTQLKNNKLDYSLITKSFEILDKTEKIIIEELYFKHTKIDKLEFLLSYERSQIHNIKNRAIAKMLNYIYGYVTW